MVYGDIKAQFGDLDEDTNLVEFFRVVLDRRNKLDKEDRQKKAAANTRGHAAARSSCSYS